MAFLNKKADPLTINLGEEKWKVYQVLKQPKKNTKKEIQDPMIQSIWKHIFSKK